MTMSEVKYIGDIVSSFKIGDKNYTIDQISDYLIENQVYITFHTNKKEKTYFYSNFVPFEETGDN